MLTLASESEQLQAQWVTQLYFAFWWNGRCFFAMGKSFFLFISVKSITRFVSVEYASGGSVTSRLKPYQYRNGMYTLYVSFFFIQLSEYNISYAVFFSFD